MHYKKIYNYYIIKKLIKIFCMHLMLILKEDFLSNCKLNIVQRISQLIHIISYYYYNLYHIIIIIHIILYLNIIFK